jgi:isocitrate dehydrogenase kinase/phosphatase
MVENHAADLAARFTSEAFDAFNVTFAAITRRARQRFEQRDWAGGRRDAAERLDAYDNALSDLAGRLDGALGSAARDQSLWIAARPRFETLVAGRYDIERAETFFNSVTRRMLRTVGVNREVEFFHLHRPLPRADAKEPVYRTYPKTAETEELVQTLLKDFAFRVPYEDLHRDAGLIAQEIDLTLWPITGPLKPFRVEAVKAVFYRNKEAYIVARILADSRTIPLIIPLSNGPSGIRAETVLLREAEANIVFSFAYSHFFVDFERYDALIRFLHSLLPQAAPSELYTSLGYNRHGKTEFYRDLHRFVHVSKEQFVIAPGQEGAVMIAFTLPNFDFVFKVIKDRPCFLRSMNDTPKVITKEKVRFQYDFVSHRDLAGRMVDTQEFENLRFKRRRFSAPLLREFELAARTGVTITKEYVILHHLYVQRKVVPLPIYFHSERDPESLRHVLIDFGYFLKDVAASGVFPCDLFNTWNYGVTHWGRVVLYDYDDVLPIERVRFREKPEPRNEYEETEPEEDWIFASAEEFFVDEIDRFSGIPGPLRSVFKSVHQDLYTVEFWDELTARVSAGELLDVIPYDRGRQFAETPSGATRRGATSLPRGPYTRERGRGREWKNSSLKDLRRACDSSGPIFWDGFRMPRARRRPSGWGPAPKRRWVSTCMSWRRQLRKPNPGNSGGVRSATSSWRRTGLRRIIPRASALST